MHITVDPIIYQQQARGGIPRIFHEILPRMCDLEPDLHICFRQDISQPALKQPLPQHPSIRHETYRHHAVAKRRPYLVWRRIVALQNTMDRIADNWQRRNHIWHSTYFTRPPTGWHGQQVVTVYDMAYERVPGFDNPYSRMFRAEKRHCVLRADHVICISEFTRREVIDFYEISAERVHAVPLAYDPTIFRVISPDERFQYDLPRYPYLLYVSGRGPHKNFNDFLEAYSTWSGRKDVNLIVVGKPFTESEQKLIHDRQLTKHIRLLSNIDDDMLCALYNGAAAFVYPSLYEGFGLSLLEAMACECPIVASRIAPSLEVAADVPFYFEIGDSMSFHAALDAALANGRDPQRIQAGHGRTALFNWDKTARQTLAIYYLCQ